ncbi:hypothetical protein CBS101457_004683 [Exobasidium rhododendri]|nr:hypothetical protein CBS101457_004683 [Exobasidium rhododendri]
MLATRSSSSKIPTSSVASQSSRLRARKRREAQIIADLLDTPSKRRGSTRRLTSGRRKLAVEESDDEGSSSSSSSSSDGGDGELSEDEAGEEKQRREVGDEEASSNNNSSSSSEDGMDSDSTNYTSDEDTCITSDEDYDEETPSKRRRVSHPSTPRKRRRMDGIHSTTTTPRAKECILNTMITAPHLPARPLNMTTLTLQDLEGLTPQARAKKLLHVGATPERLPCREDQFEEVLACLEDAVQDGIGGCVYVSGVPGVGKTATIREAIRSLKFRAKTGLTSPFKFVEINGMKLNDAQDAYSLLWQTLSGARCSNKLALRQLSRHFTAASQRRAGEDESETTTTTVVLMDELDQLVTTRQEVMYNMFNWPNTKNSRLIVIAVANTMDLPERILNPKVASRLGMTRIIFKPYNDKQLVEIVHSRLGMGAFKSNGRRSPVEEALVKGCDDIFEEDAIIYISKRVSNVSGDARRMLDVCRRAIDSVEMQQHDQAKQQKDALPMRKVKISDVMKIIDAIVKSGKVSHLIKLPLQAKVTLLSILACSRRSGVAEVDLAAILAHQRTLCRMQAIPAALDLETLSPVLSQLSALGLLIAVGNGAGTGKSGMYARFLLACQEDEVRLALEQDEDRRLRNML